MAQSEDPPAEVQEISEEQFNSMSEQERLIEAGKRAQQAAGLQQMAQGLMDKAKVATDPAEREKLLQDAHSKEVAAHGNSKMARMLQSGTFQGAAGGGGIGAGVAMGLGTVVGTLVGGVTAIPTTAVGGLVGAGVGFARGPFIKMGDPGQKKDANGKPVPGVPQAGGKDIGSASANATTNKENASPAGSRPGTSDGKPRKKPKKLEVRSGKDTQPKAS